MYRRLEKLASFQSKIPWPGLAILAAAAIGCAAVTGSAKAPTSAPATAPATAPSAQSFQDPGGLVRVQYPGEWKPQRDPDYALELTAGPETFTLDIPDLPPHIPGMIPLSLVVNGYIDDLKKSHPGVKTDEETSPAISKARARRLHSAWSEKNGLEAEVTTLIVHGDHVFIFRIVCPADQLAADRIGYNGIVGSLRWLK